MTYHHTFNIYLVKPDLLERMDRLLTATSPPHSYMDQVLRETWRELLIHHVIPDRHCHIVAGTVCSINISSRCRVVADWIASAASVNALPLLKRFAGSHAVYFPKQLTELQSEVRLLCDYSAWDEAEIYGWDDIHLSQGQKEAYQFSIKGGLFTAEAESYDEDNQPRDLFIFLFRLQELLKTATEHDLGILYFSFN